MQKPSNNSDNKKQETENILDFLTPLLIFRQLEAEAIQAVATELTERHLSAGEILFHQGDLGEAFYILTAGALQVRIDSDDKTDAFINPLNAGECVGEMSLLTGQPRTGTVSALGDSELLCLTKPDFMDGNRQPQMITFRGMGRASRLLQWNQNES